MTSFSYHRKIKVPYEGETESHADNIVRDPLALPTRPCSAAANKQEVQVDDAAKAGLIGEVAEEFEANFGVDVKRRVVPVSHCWMPSGDLYCGCEGGQLLKVDTETQDVKVGYELLVFIFEGGGRGEISVVWCPCRTAGCLDW